MARTVTHWGTYDVESDGTEITAVHSFPKDHDPSPIGQSLRAVTRSRVRAPSIRKSWLEGEPGDRRGELRGREPFVEVDWDTALELAAAELERVRSELGNGAIYGGSYGWASAGRFHHAQSQLHRFLATIGGYVSKRDTYSHAAGEVIVPHVLGHSFGVIQGNHTSLEVIAGHTDLLLAFGGIPMKNAQVQSGGMGRHTLRGHLELARDRGTRFVNISPVRDDLMDELDAEWIPSRPGSDVAIMLALIHELDATGRADQAFLADFCEGWPVLADHVRGTSDGVPKSPAWAAALSEVPEERIRELAAEMVAGRTMLNIAWGLQRSDRGEQTWWALIALACVIGQIGLPGGGFGLGYGAVASVGNGASRRPFPALERGQNPVADFIPVSRIADMLLHPGEPYTYNGQDRAYPSIDLVYWAGGNPFHHHQDLNRLVEAWQRPSTIIVNEPFWTATARHADIVLPATTPLERHDIGGSPQEDFLFWMEPALGPVGEARDDYEIFSGLAERLGHGREFTEGRSTQEWLEHLYAKHRARHADVPDFDAFRDEGFIENPPDPAARRILLEAFRNDPVGEPLPTPSGKIELFSPTLAGFGYHDCPGHPAFFEPEEWLGSVSRFPLHMISNQPPGRLHSQLDHGETSQARKRDGREIMRMHPTNAAQRGLHTGSVARVFNERGACYVSVEVTDRVREDVVELPTGAWYDPESPGGACRHGNPNVLTRDAGSSSLAQGPVAQSCLVEVEAAPDAPVPAPHQAPEIIARD